MTPEQQQLIADVDTHANALAASLIAATEAGIPHPFILPRLVLAFRSAFGSEPPNITELLRVVGA